MEDKPTKEDLERFSRLVKKFGFYMWDVESRVFHRLEEEMENIIKWARTPKDKRKPANTNWTASPQRQIGYLIEKLEYKIKELNQKVK